MGKKHSRRLTDFWLKSRVRFAAVAVAALALIAPLLVPTVASAAGSGVLNVTIEPVNYLTGTPQATAAYGTFGDRVGYKISYSCASDACLGTTIQLSPSQPDPYGLAAQATLVDKTMMVYENWTAPSGASISGTDATGKLITLGDLAAGDSGTFTMYYYIAPSGTYSTARAAQFYPDGFQIQNSATIASSTATAPVTSPAAPVTWHIGVPDPSMTKYNPGTVKPGTNVTYTIAMGSGSFPRRDATAVTGTSAWQAASNYVVVDQLPAQAVYVSSSGAGVYDAVAHTVTWSSGTAANPVYTAAGGWGYYSNSGWVARSPYGARTVTVQYPAANFTNVNGCEFDENVTNTATATIGYLDTAKTVKSTTSSATHAVSCYSPFGRSTMVKGSTRDAGSASGSFINVPPTVTGMTCPAGGTDQWGRACTPGAALAAFGNNIKYWDVVTYNQGNVPGIATVTDNTLDLAGAPVYSIAVSQASKIEWTYQCTTGGVISGTSPSVTTVALTAPQQAAGCRYQTVKVTSSAIAPVNIKPTDTGGTGFTVRFTYQVSTAAQAYMGQTRTNSASSVMSYPGYADATGTALPDLARTASHPITFRAWPLANAAKPGFAASFPAAAAVAGGGNAVPGRDVTFSVTGTTANIPADEELTPQYVFIAPAGWVITEGSAGFSAAVPAGVTYQYVTKTIGGVARQVVVATWPDTVAFGKNSVWPTMTVVAHPTYAVAAGTTSVATTWMGDSRQTWDNTTANYAGPVQDAVDIDDDSSNTEWFSSASQNVLVSSADGVTVTKEICLLVGTTCTWVSDPDQVVPVSTTASNIQYRVTIQNTGNTNLTGVVAYDVLPYVGDTGTSDGTAGTGRGSTFNETLASVSDVSSNVTLSYSSSTNPNRPEVFTGTTSAADWNSTVTGKAAIRAAVTGSLAPGATATFTYAANVGAGASADAKACNSVAVDTTQTLPSEPRPVCATTAEADLRITVPNRLPLQNGRPGVVPFTVTNLGGSAQAVASATIEVPAGITVTSLAPTGWSCAADPAQSAPIAGPVTLDCAPVDGSGASRALAKDAPETIDLAVLPTVVAASQCFAGSIAGPMNDPVLGNNATSACLQVFTAAPAIAVTKDDGRSTVAIGDEFTYTLTVANKLVGETLADIVITDALPAGLAFVSASDGGTESGGTVTWPAVTLAQVGVAASDGSTATGGAGSSLTRTVTVKVTAAATGSVTNTATATAPDPATPAAALTGSGSDIDTLRKLSVTKTTSAPAVGVLAGDVLTYTVTITNVGTAAYVVGSPATLRDDLSAVLDDATYVAGSGSVSINDGTATSVANPVAGILSWSGALPVGQAAVISYQMKVGDGTAGDKKLVNAAFTATATGNSCDTTTGLDTAGFACVVTTTPFAPKFSKSIVSVSQNDDGRWTIVYGLDVVNLNDAASVTYSVTDTLKLGAGITASTASVTQVPAGVTAATWSGSGAVASGVVLPAATAHHYELTVVAGVGIPGAGAACVTGANGGFGNSATLSPVGGAATTAFACASPVVPDVAKSVATPTQNPDGAWSVVYTITVTAPTGSPATGLAYTLDDTFAFPADVAVQGVAVAGPSGSAINPAFNGGSSKALLTAADHVLAGIPRVYTVTVTTEVPAGAVTGSALACAPAGNGGYANGVSLRSGTSSTVLDTAAACDRVTAQPTPVVAKNVVSTSINSTTGDWTIEYQLTVTNPSAAYSTEYDLSDELQFGEGITIVSADAESTDATVSGTWDGLADATLVQGVALPADAVHTYTVTVVASPPVITDATAAAVDCRIDAGETGTGFRNVATLQSGVVTPAPFAVACEAATDPSVVKATVGQPVQDPSTGVWTVVYEITVKNRATTTVPAGIDYALTDEFGFAPGTQVVSVTTDGPGTINPSFDGDTDIDFATGNIGAAADEDTAATHVYTVTVEFVPPAGLTAQERACDVAQGDGGLRNEVEVAIGPRVTGAVACADLPDVPVAGIAKEVLSQTQQPDGTWEVLYRITVANPEPSVTTIYGLNDQFAFGAGIQATDASIVAAPGGVTVNHAGFDGDTDTLISEDVVLPGGASHTYTVRAVIDSGAVTGDSDAGDCTLGGDETGTGFLNTVVATSGGADRADEACATAHDPSVAKTVDGSPVLNADGSWTVNYIVTVLNPSNVGLSYGLTDELAFPEGTEFDAATVVARDGSPQASASWNGVGDTVVIENGTALAAGATHVFDVSVTATLPDGQESVEEGWANRASVASSTGAVVTSDSSVAADIELPELVITKSSDAAAVVRIGDEVTYTVTAQNTGEGDFTTVFPAEVWDYLDGVLDDAAFNGSVTVTPSTGGIQPLADRFAWAGPLASGETVVLTYTVVVTAAGDQELVNAAYAPQQPGAEPELPDACDGDRCVEVSTALPAFLLEKTVSTGVVTAGDEVTYTVTYTNTGTVDVANATFTDNLSDVVDDATVTVPWATSGEVERNGDTLAWTGPLAAGASVTVTYAATVGTPLTGDGHLTNRATADPDFWAPEPEATTETAVRALAFTKVADATQTTIGQKVTYTVTLTNIGEADYTSDDPATVVDTLTGVIDDATYNADAKAASGVIAYSTPALAWSGPLAAGESVDVTFSVTVTGGGDGKLTNIIGLSATDAAGSACLAAPTDNAAEACFVNTAIAPLASTGASMNVALWLIAILVLLLGAIAVLLDTRRRRIRQ